MCFGVFALRADALNLAALDLPTRLARPICTVHAQASGTFSRPTASLAGNRNGIEHRFDLGDVGTLTGRDDDRQWACVAIGTKKQLARAAAP